MNKISLEHLAQRMAVLISTLKPYEKIEIKLQDNATGEVSILLTSNHKELFTVE